MQVNAKLISRPALICGKSQALLATDPAFVDRPALARDPLQR